MTRRKRTVVMVAICLCAMFFCTTRAQAEEIDPSSFKVEEEQGSIVMQVLRMEKTTYVYRNGETEQVGETREEIWAYYITDRDETLESIATKLQVLPEKLMAENDNIQPLEDGTYPVRTRLKLPEVDWDKVEEKVYYYVDIGDCLSLISEYFGIDTSKIIQCNNKEREVVVSNEGCWYTKDLTKNPCEQKDIYRMFTLKKKMYLMENPQNSTWRICREITNPDVIYAGDFIRIK